MRDTKFLETVTATKSALSLVELGVHDTSDTQLGEEVNIRANNVDFVLIDNREDFLHFEHKELTLVLVCITEPGQVISKVTLEALRTEKLEQDDVLQQEFYKNVVFYGAEKEEVELQEEAVEMLATWNTKSWCFIKGNNHSLARTGPYVYAGGRTWQPWRVYSDFNGVFMCTFKPGPANAESLVKVDEPKAGLNGRVLVPSRCYFNPSESRPLDGARISVKDNIDIAGHRTTLCNRAWEDFYPPKSKHAACVQTLINAGAIIVGKAKLQAMIMREEPLECVEFTAPFNPRGDGYQVPSGSSHGSAAGIGSYDWLDFSLGSDTNGSGRKPASYNGCFSIRPSTGILNTTGVIGQFDKFDMPVFFGRDVSKFADFISVWYGSSPLLQQPSKKKVRVLYPEDYLPTSNKSQTLLIDTFVAGLEYALGITRTKISLADRWKEECPDGKENANLAEYLRLAGGYPYYRDSYYNLHDFRTLYEEKHGKPPFVHRAMHWQWNVSKTISPAERDFYWRRSELYRQWLLNKVFDANNQDCITVMVFPIEEGKPNYRDSVPPPYAILSGYSPLNMAPMLRAPELTAIVGEITYQSIVTQRDEPLPIAASVIGAPGTDLILAQLVQKGLEAARLPVKVKTGRSVY